ncbi:hypothetical protein TNIN_191061 [Trichonephila inaurata madagascariensis]|uniref:Uncharacterized protein n=1 Tax=Trichonephila inaurata madagascariensis TaxID=2747483 RepID=A0A8X7CP44_9ARAC|nr:hypothetical protein TNIN_191061 [Trichonephila inaurata madagascariensis]
MTSFLIVEGKKSQSWEKEEGMKFYPPFQLPCKKVAFSEYTWQFQSLPDVGLVEVFLDHSKQYCLLNSGRRHLSKMPWLSVLSNQLIPSPCRSSGNGLAARKTPAHLSLSRPQREGNLRDSSGDLLRLNEVP